MVNQKFCSFDLEQADPFPEDGQIQDYASLGITCAACVRSDKLLTWIGDSSQPDVPPVLTYYAGMYQTPNKPYWTPPPRMDSLEIGELIEYLLEEARQDYRPLTWNGASYDFRMLAEASPEYRDQIRDQLVFPGYDMMFHFLSCAGHFLGLDAACKGQGISGKILDPILGDGSSMNGQKAVEYWPEHWRIVVDYVSQDVIAPVLLAEAVTQKDGFLEWTSQAGKPTGFNLCRVKVGRFEYRDVLEDFRWLTVQECLDLPDPDQSWMTSPVTKKDFLSYWA